MEFNLAKPARFLLLIALAVSVLSAHAQYFHPKNIDVGAGVLWQYTTQLASDGQVGGGGINHQYTTNPVGFVAQLRDSPRALLGFEVNYAYTHPTESYNYYYNNGTLTSLSVPTGTNEFTLAYLARPHLLFLHPFFSIGGGLMGFAPDHAGSAVTGTTATLQTQWRGAGVAEVGLDLQLHDHLGVRVQTRLVGTRAPNFHALVISTDSWTLSTEPSVGGYYRF